MTNCIYQIIDSSGGIVNTIVLDPNSNWEPPAGCTIKLFVEPEYVPERQIVLTQLEFLRRFTAEERIAIRLSTDPMAVDFLYLLNLAKDVNLDDPDAIAGVNYLESINLLNAGRAAEILA